MGCPHLKRQRRVGPTASRPARKCNLCSVGRPAGRTKSTSEESLNCTGLLPSRLAFQRMDSGNETKATDLPSWEKVAPWTDMPPRKGWNCLFSCRSGRARPVGTALREICVFRPCLGLGYPNGSGLQRVEPARRPAGETARAAHRAPISAFRTKVAGLRTGKGRICRPESSDHSNCQDPVRQAENSSSGPLPLNDISQIVPSHACQPDERRRQATKRNATGVRPDRGELCGLPVSIAPHRPRLSPPGVE